MHLMSLLITCYTTKQGANKMASDFSVFPASAINACWCDSTATVRLRGFKYQRYKQLAVCCSGIHCCAGKFDWHQRRQYNACQFSSYHKYHKDIDIQQVCADQKTQGHSYFYSQWVRRFCAHYVAN